MLRSAMSLLEQIYKTAKILPEPAQEEAMHYIEYLRIRTEISREEAAWTRFSAEQLSAAYSPSAAIYDDEEPSAS